MEQGLISIIIPVYNRAHLIEETLSSISRQSYSQWECIIVDDGSIDNSRAVIKTFSENDTRFQLYERPINRRKGANACRNYGFEISKGEFVNWFDSDDLMMENNLELKMKAFDEKTDFVIGNSLNFDEKGTISRPYTLHYDLPLTPENFIGCSIGWITNDVLIRRSKVWVSFNENLNSGQEYNFFSRLLYKTTRGTYIKADVAKRRIHRGSIQQKLQTTTTASQDTTAFINEVILLKDIEKFASTYTKERSIKRIIRYSYNLSEQFKIKRSQIATLKILFIQKYYKKLFYYLLWCLSNLVLGRGYFILQQTK